MKELKYTLGATYKIILVDNTERQFTFIGGNPARVRFLDDNSFCPIENLPTFRDIELVSEN